MSLQLHAESQTWQFQASKMQSQRACFPEPTALPHSILTIQKQLPIGGLISHRLLSTISYWLSTPQQQRRQLLSRCLEVAGRPHMVRRVLGQHTLAMPSAISTPTMMGSFLLKTQLGNILRMHGKMASNLAASCSSSFT